MRTQQSGTAERTRTWGEWLALTLGVVYVVVGLAGFLVTSGVAFAARDGMKLLGIFEVNPLHNIVHLAIGIALVGAFLAGRMAVAWVAGVIGAVYLLLGIVGPFIADTKSNILALNASDHVLHIGSGIALLAAAYGAASASSRRDATTNDRMDLAA